MAVLIDVYNIADGHLPERVLLTCICLDMGPSTELPDTYDR
jgi:hypothetical protein